MGPGVCIQLCPLDSLDWRTVPWRGYFIKLPDVGHKYFSGYHYYASSQEAEIIVLSIVASTVYVLSCDYYCCKTPVLTRRSAVTQLQ